MANTDFEVIIIGGSYAGLSAGLTLGRSLRRVLVIDSGKPCNWQTPHSHNFLTRDGETPAEIAKKAREQAAKYPTVELKNGLATAVNQKEAGFEVETADGMVFKAKKILFTTGVTDSMPDIAGFKESWGISILHCPYCHGYEVHSRKLGILANGDTGFELTRLIYNWSKDLVLFTNGSSTLTQDQLYSIEKYAIPIIETPVLEIVHKNGYVQNVRLADHSEAQVEAIFSRVPYKQHSTIPALLGCTLTDTGFIQVDEWGKTTIHGVYAAGDNSTMLRSLSAAAAAGSRTGAGINKDLIVESL